MNEKDYKELLKHPKRLSPIRAIRLKCWDCCGRSDEEIYKCTCKDTCILWPYRTGKNPYLAKKKLSEEQKRGLAERLKRISCSSSPTV